MEEEVQLILMDRPLTMEEGAPPIQMALGGARLILMDQEGIQRNLDKVKEVGQEIPLILTTGGKLQPTQTACMVFFLMEASQKEQPSSLLSKHAVLPRLT